jgi:4-hydroxy-tetrahydrodipicolinate synthase
MGCAAVMTLPPFYYKGVSEDGLYAYFEQLVGAIGAAARIFLYHIPPITLVGIPPRLAARLHHDFPEQIIGIKDSSGDWENTRALLEIDGLIVYPGSELPLLDALELGSPGCISATANINCAAIGKVIDLFNQGEKDAAHALHATVVQFRKVVQEYAPIPAQKRLLAESTGDSRWSRVRPPLAAMSEEKGRALAAALAAIRES